MSLVSQASQEFDDAVDYELVEPSFDITGSWRDDVVPGSVVMTLAAHYRQPDGTQAVWPLARRPRTGGQ